MKNIHLIPTNKPSRLHLGDNGNLILGLMKNSIESKNNDFTNQNIYITNNEEIEEGNWFTDNNNSLKKSYRLSHVQFADPKKIILTTNLDLIKDGVQAIDDEFLEWFVKNPNCEEVEIETFFVPRKTIGYDSKYKLLIPKGQFKNK